MVIYPLAAAFVLIWLLLTLRNADNGLLMAIAVIPFGMFAAMVAGGLSIILANLLAIFTIGVLVIRLVSLRENAPSVHLPKASLYLFLFAIYSVFSALILVRLFQGQFLVFPLSVTFKGTMVSAYYPSTMVPLRPTNSNISQSFYIVLTAMFFLAAVLIVRRRGLAFGEKGLVWAAGINVVLGVLDLLQLDGLLELIRTADYSLNNQQTMAGIARIIGGYAEPASFGTVSTAFFAYFAMSFLIGNRPRDAWLAVGNLVFAVLALSSTAFLSLVVGCFLIVLHAPVFLAAGLSRKFAHYFVITIAFAVITILLLLLLTPMGTVLVKILDPLLFSKGTSLSGLERAAWANNGIDTFFRTWGLGAGAGSLRSNGFLAVLLGNVGIPGTLAFGLFLLHGVGRRIPACDRPVARTFYAGRVGALTLFASMLVSGTSPDPTLLLVVFICMSVVAREMATASTAASATSRLSTLGQQ